MKRNITLAAMIWCVCLVSVCYAQDGGKKTAVAATPAPADTLKPYQKFTGLPAFNIMGMDSSTIFNTYNISDGKPTALMLFSPDCKHCKKTITALLAGMDSIKNIHFYLVTGSHSMSEIKDFYTEHHLANYKNIQMVGRDYEFFFFSYYQTKFVPDIALYDAHKKLVKLIEGETTASEIYKYIH